MEQLFADGNTGRAVQAFSPRTTIAETENAYEIQVEWRSHKRSGQVLLPLMRPG